MTKSAANVRNPLPRGTLVVGASLVIAGMATFVFFKVGEWALGSKEGFAPLASMWFALFALAPGFFLPLEQELSRSISERREMGIGARPVVIRVAQIGAIITASVIAVLALAGPYITNHYFDGDVRMTIALIVAFASYAPSLIARGVTAGMGRFGAYAIVISSDGVVRVLVCVLLAGLGRVDVATLGFAVAVSPLIPFTLVGLKGKLNTEPGPPARLTDVSHHLGWLVVGSVSSAALINSGPVLTNLLSGPDERALITVFGQGLLIARVPLFLFQAVQATLLPGLSRLATAQDFDGFRRHFWSLMTWVVGIAIGGTVAGYVIGPWVVDLVYAASIGHRDVALLALGSGVVTTAIATSQAVIAVRGHAWVAAGWVSALVMLGFGTWWSSSDLFLRIEIGFVLAAVTALVTFLIALNRRLAVLEHPRADTAASRDDR